MQSSLQYKDGDTASLSHPGPVHVLLVTPFNIFFDLVDTPSVVPEVD